MSSKSSASSTESAAPQTSAWGNEGGRRLANNLANSGQANQHAKIWIPQWHLEPLRSLNITSWNAQSVGNKKDELADVLTSHLNILLLQHRHTSAPGNIPQNIRTVESQS
ncbi:hypothetical protein GWI33_022824 [Rhynchophorus ferrugineus]|uniref:Uncharacterized protein n=1 Tax=Rhynchophorus ferrugineus TaxID=354439 RepID=A0A834MHI4_RHYFE|nr:hypothetical protein GWI33_022824 [Rhynchophorus ferrugineus]